MGRNLMVLVLVRVSRKGSPSVPGSSMINLMCGCMASLKFVDLIFPGGTVDIINIPEPPFDKCWKCRNG